MSIFDTIRSGNSRTKQSAGENQTVEDISTMMGVGRILYEAVVVDFFSNPEEDLLKAPPENEEVYETYRESLLYGANQVSERSKLFINKMPRCSLTAVVTSELSAWGLPDPEVFFPLFSHITVPVKPGEKIWVIYEKLERGVGLGRGFWITRISSDIRADDINYTHFDRENLYKQVKTQSDSPYGSSENQTYFNEQDIYGFPLGGGSNLAANTIPGDAPYTSIVENSLSYIEQFNGEPVPRYSPRVGDFIIQGSNNTLISLGQDRPSLSGPEDTSDEKGIGAIDIVVGRGQTDDTSAIADVDLSTLTDGVRDYSEINKFPSFLDMSSNPGEGNPDFQNDLSRIYMSMKTNADENFSIEVEGMDQSDGESPAIVVKTDQVRLIARQDLKITVGESGTGSAIVMKADGDIVFIPGSEGIIKLGGDNADKAILTTDSGYAGESNGTVFATPPITTQGGVIMTGGAQGAHAFKILVT
jgi:hypothetical protein